MIRIVLLLVIDLILIYDFYLGGIIDGVDVLSLDRQAKWKVDVGQAFIVIIVTGLLIREVIRSIAKKYQNST